MLLKVRVVTLVGVLAAVSVIGVAPVGAATEGPEQRGAVSSGHAQASRLVALATKAPQRPRLKSSPKQVEEGDRFTLTATIRSPRKATRVTLEQWYVPPYFGTPRWETAKSLRVRGKKKVKFRTVATNIERYRVAVAYQETTKLAVSQPVGVTVWRWIPLSKYAPYYETHGIIFGQTSINGHAYAGIGAAYYSHAGAWEARFTPGRRCKAFRGVIGLDDISDDGSSGTVTLTGDDAPVYSSPVLTPGMAVPVTVPLDDPYRFGVQLFDTSPEDTESWPAIGEPALLCHGG